MVTATFTIRRAQPGDELVLRDLRITALTDSPGAFSSTLEREMNRTAENWRTWVTPPSVTFILESAERKPCGLVAGALDKADPSIALLMSMWVHPSHRGTGAASRLIALIQQWAAESRARELRLSVVEQNAIARRCYERAGFRTTGRHSVDKYTGEPEIEMSYAVTG
jgi:RimJ/RimL family protein N-acetyltransferase